MGTRRAYSVPALAGRALDLPRTLEANRVVVTAVQEFFADWTWAVDKPVFAALHREGRLRAVLDAPDDAATGQPMCLVLRGAVTHVDGLDVGSPEGQQRLERVRKSFQASADYRATLRSFAMKARIDEAIWANVSGPFLL